VILDVTTDVAAWKAGALNRGWVLLASRADVWSARSSVAPDESVRPTLEIAYTLPGGTGYTKWQLAQFGAAAGQPGTLPGDDPDRDGANNLLEYVCNTHPTRSSLAHLPLVGRNGQGTTFSFPRNLDAVDITLRVEAKSGLTQPAWSAIAVHTEVDGWLTAIGSTLTETGGVVTITEGAAAPQRFYRIRATKP
jgi:hypothetical protein